MSKTLVLSLSTALILTTNAHADHIQNTIIGDAEEVITMNKIEYITGKPYHFQNDSGATDQYRVVRKTPDLIGAYIVERVASQPGHLQVVYMTQYLRNIELARSVIKKGTVEYSHYYLNCQRDFHNNAQLNNQYFESQEVSNGIFEYDAEYNEITPVYATYRDLTQICKHRYPDQHNAI